MLNELETAVLANSFEDADKLLKCKSFDVNTRVPFQVHKYRAVQITLLNCAILFLNLNMVLLLLKHGANMTVPGVTKERFYYDDNSWYSGLLHVAYLTIVKAERNDMTKNEKILLLLIEHCNCVQSISFEFNFVFGIFVKYRKLEHDLADFFKNVMKTALLYGAKIEDLDPDSDDDSDSDSELINDPFFNRHLIELWPSYLILFCSQFRGFYLYF